MGTGENLKRILSKKGMTIKGLSEISGVPLNTLYSITKRDSKNTRSATLQKIADALGVHISELSYHNVQYDDTVDPRWSELDEKIKSETSTLEERQEYWRIINNAAEGLKERDATGRFLDRLLDFHVAHDELILTYYHRLNNVGRKEAVKRMFEIAQLPKYTDNSKPEDGEI